MRSADWRVIGSFGITLGVILLIGSFLAYVYEEQRWIFVVAPYRDLAAPLAIAGVVLLVVGYVSNNRAQEEKKLEAERAKIITTPPTQPSPTQPAAKFCKYCGYALSSDAKYCSRCGKALD